MALSPRLLKGSAFTPRSISGLAIWLDASSSDLYTTDAGPVVAVASPLDIAGCALWLDGADSSAASMTLDGTAVSSWRDKSGNGRDFTASGTARPTLTASGLNGKSVVTFDGSNDQLTNATNVVGFSSVTMFAVVYRQTGTYGGIITSTSADNTPALIIENTNIGVRGYGQVSVTAGGFTGPAVVCGRVNAGATEIFTDGLVRDSDAVSGSLGSVTTTAIGTYRLAAANYLNGYIAEIIVYPTALTTAQRASVEAYLAAKWSISGVHAPATATSDPVGYWGDKSGNGRHLLQPTSTARPTRVSSHVNGRTALTFDGTDFLSVANSVALGNNTVIMVVREDASANYGGLISYYPPSGNDNNNADGWVADLQLTDNVISLSSGIFSAQWAGAFSLPLSVLTLRRQTDAGNRQIIRANGVTNAVNANASTGTAAGILIGGRFQSGAVDTLYRAKITVCEVLRWDRALTPAEYTRAETALARKWGITLAPQVSNADAQNWIDRVYSNGGTVSTSTAAAVNQFCVDIENAPGGSIRDRFFRLNIFCGGTSGTAVGLNSALVPLFRGPSLGGTQYGGATDTNLGSPAFLATDYEETGVNGGLNGNGSSKYLLTGLTPSAMPSLATGHLSVYSATGFAGSTIYALLSSLGTGFANNFSIEANRNGAGNLYGAWGEGGSFATLATPAQGSGNGHTLISRTGSTILAAYRDGVLRNTSSTSVTPAASSAQFGIFHHSNSGAPLNIAAARLGGYSIGASMDATQAAAFYTAMQTFQTALTRNV